MGPLVRLIFINNFRRYKSDQNIVLEVFIFVGYIEIGAAHEARTRDLDLGKVALYQLS